MKPAPAYLPFFSRRWLDAGPEQLLCERHTAARQQVKEEGLSANVVQDPAVAVEVITRVARVLLRLGERPHPWAPRVRRSVRERVVAPEALLSQEAGSSRRMRRAESQAQIRSRARAHSSGERQPRRMMYCVDPSQASRSDPSVGGGQRE